MQCDLPPDRVTGPGCGFENAVRLRSADVRLGTVPSLNYVVISLFSRAAKAARPALMMAHAPIPTRLKVAHAGGLLRP